MGTYRIPPLIQIAIAAVIGFGGTLTVATTGISLPDVTALFSGNAATLPDGAPATCPIKGNISLSDERIYHMPGQRYYDVTDINPTYGERWFCSEAEARAAGWRRSKV